jgi:hypothetical protein
MHGYVLELADAVIVYEPFGTTDHGRVVPAEAHQQFPLGLLCCSDEGPRLGGVDRHGLLAKDVGTKLERGADMIVMKGGRA